MAEEQERKRKKSAGPSLLTVQSILCGVVLLIALIFRLIGGGFYEELRTVFRDVLTDNGLADTVSAFLESEHA